MIIAVTLLYVFLIAIIVAFGFLFYFLDKRQQEMDQQISDQLMDFKKTVASFQSDVTELKKLINLLQEEDIKLLQDNSLTLKKNQDTLANDIEILMHEFKKLEKSNQR